MIDDTTMAPSADGLEKRSVRGESRLGFVVLWANGEPSLVGTFLRLDPKQSVGVMGRGGRQFDDPYDRLVFLQSRPFGNKEVEPVSNPRLSRRQMVVREQGNCALLVENLGQCKLICRGVEQSQHRVEAGDILELKRQMLLLCVEREPVKQQTSLPQEMRPDFGLADRFGVVGESPSMWALRSQIGFAARHEGHVLLLGPSGSGKERAAGAIHGLSAWGAKVMVSRNAATFPSTLIDAELFGNTRDYPNRGMPSRPGLIGAADGSTLFLDEIAELASELQAKLLRVLDEGGEYHRLGNATSSRAKFRLIGATNRPMGDLRGDLAARMRLRIQLPSLDDHRDDIPLLCNHLLRKASLGAPEIGERFFDGEWPRISIELMAGLAVHSYTRNVRELENIIWQSLATSQGNSLELTDSVREELSCCGGQELSVGVEISVEALRESLERHKGVQERVWKELGLKNRFVLMRLMKKYGLSARNQAG